MIKASKKSKKIIAATSVTIFSLFAFVTGAYAWFTSMMKYQSGVDGFKVNDPGDIEISSVKLIKFIYPTGIGGFDYDYLSPLLGHVYKYDYNYNEDSFGYYSDPLDLESWVEVPLMNRYDPIESIIKPSTRLIDLNCNAVYEITLHCDKYANSSVDLTSSVELDDSVILGPNEILLSDCASFDMYTTSDLSDTNPLFYDEVAGDYKKYYPVYDDVEKDLDGADTVTKNYHKISYLSSLVAELSHAHLYGAPKLTEADIDTKEVTFDASGDVTFYLNVNYAPNQINHYSKQIYVNDILAKYDFSFSFSIGGGE